MPVQLADFERFTLFLDRAQHIGDRKQQEDALGFSEPGNDHSAGRNGVLAVVADGMGGMALGSKASAAAVRTFTAAYEAKSRWKSVPQALCSALDQANEEVLDLTRDISRTRAGTTLIATVVRQDGLYWISIGDSRIYLYRAGRLIQLTEDHNYLQYLTREVARGRISQQKADQNPDRDALTSYLGQDGLEEISRNDEPLALQSGDRLLLCTDGLYGGLAEEELAQTMSTDSPAVCQSLIELKLAKQAPRQDNLTAVVLTCAPLSASFPVEPTRRVITTRRIFDKFWKTLPLVR